MSAADTVVVPSPSLAGAPIPLAATDYASAAAALTSSSYHVPLRQSNFKLQGLPLLDNAPSMTLDRVSMTTEEFLRVPQHLRHNGGEGGNGAVVGMPLRPHVAQRYLMGTDRYSAQGSVGYSDRSNINHDSGAAAHHHQKPTLTLDRNPHCYSHGSPYYSHRHGNANAVAAATMWRDRVPFSCPVRYPELMSYDPLLINSRVLGLTRDIGMRNTAPLLEAAAAQYGSLGGGDAFSLGVDRGVTGMSLRKHSVAYRMGSHRTYPGLGAGGGHTLGAATERFLDPFIAGHDKPEGDDFGTSAGNGAPMSRAARLRAMGISGFAPPSGSGSGGSRRSSSAAVPATLRDKGQRSSTSLSGGVRSSSSSGGYRSSASGGGAASSSSSGRPRYADYLAQQREDAHRKANASLIGAIGSTFGQLAADERQRASDAMLSPCGGRGGAAGGDPTEVQNTSSNFGFGHRDGDLNVPSCSAAMPTRHLSRDWNWVDVDPASSFLAQHASQPRDRAP